MSDALSTELFIFGLSVVLLLVHIVWQSSSMTRDTSVGYNMGPRDTEKPVSVVTGRLSRALRNYLETYAAFVGLALALHITGKTGGAGEIGAWIWLAARIVYLPLFAFGVFRWRSIVWMVSILGLVLMLYRLMF
ncbi:MAG: MAPEG family protein [Mesorhizobium sp.]